MCWCCCCCSCLVVLLSIFTLVGKSSMPPDSRTVIFLSIDTLPILFNLLTATMILPSLSSIIPSAPSRFLQSGPDPHLQEKSDILRFLIQAKGKLQSHKDFLVYQNSIPT